jgi:alpha-beta hydrolase superfamily lysophospholipase
VHGVAASRDEWAALQSELADRGIGSLALDLRGHGQSLAGPPNSTDFTGFDASGQWPRAQNDVEAAAAFLKKRGIPDSRLIYIGASIGANLVSRAQPRPRCLVLLSPGTDYRGVRLAPPTPQLPTLVAASPQDGYAAQTSSAYAAAGKNVTLLPARAGHGAQMLSDPNFLDALLRWLERQDR